MYIRRFDRRDATNSAFQSWHLTILKINLYQKLVSVTLNRSERNIKYKFISTLHVQMKFISLKLHDRRCALIYFRKSNGYLRQSSCPISKIIAKSVKNEKQALVIESFRVLANCSAQLPQSSLKLVCEASLRKNTKIATLTNINVYVSRVL